MAGATTFYFHVHQPVRLKKYSIFHDSCSTPWDAYFDQELNQSIFWRATKKCYYPATQILHEKVLEYDGRFKVAFSITGVWLEMAQKLTPYIVDLFRAMLDTDSVELLGETYYHSLAGLYDEKEEFREQVKMHREIMKDVFGVEPRVFRNTEAIYDNNIASEIERMGYKGIITEGSSRVLGWRSPNYLYRNKDGNMKVLMRNFQLSDDIAFRFSSRNWHCWPLTAEKFADWLKGAEGDIVNIYVDYETFGEHHWPENGIHDFLKHLPGRVLEAGSGFSTPSEAVDRFDARSEVDVPFAISWADQDRDVSTWLGNKLQHQCFKELRDLEGAVKARGDPDIQHIWRLLQTSDHLYYLSTKTASDGEVHQYFSPYGSPYDAFVNYVNIIRDMARRIHEG